MRGKVNTRRLIITARRARLLDLLRRKPTFGAEHGRGEIRRRDRDRRCRRYANTRQVP
jgi:hypothetical protein